MSDKGAFTRTQAGKASYIDYLVTTGVKVCHLSLGTHFGASDHLLVTCTVKGFDPIIRHRRRFLFKKKAQAAISKLLDEDHDPERLLALPAADFFQELSLRLKVSATIYEPKSMSFFRAIKIVEEELKQVVPDWKKVRRVVLSCNRTEFLLLLEEIDALRRGNELKEYYNKVSSILKVRKVGLTVHEIENPSNPDEILHEPSQLKEVLSSKYRTLFATDDQQEERVVGYITPARTREVRMTAELVSTNKGLGKDCVPDSTLKIENPMLWRKLTAFINQTFERGLIPSPFCCARLHLLNKLKLASPA